MTKNNSRSLLSNIFTVLVGALLMGFLWRVRGTHGWGSSWGLLNAGIIFILFITVALGDRKKMNFAWTSLSSLAFMLTVPAWGTLLNQITGVLRLDDGFAYISPASGIFMMVCLGLGVASIFGIMLGRGYSDKRWRIWDFVILIAVFFAVSYLAKAFISPFIIQLVQPESVKVFTDDLRSVGIEDSAYKVFMQHFDNDSWAKKFTMEALGRTSVAGRNYFQEIKTISSAIAAIAVLFVTRFIIKDKRAASTGAVTCIAFATAITVSDLFFYFENGGYHMLQENMLPSTFAGWSLWEYFTGFIAGGIITAYMLSLKEKDDFCEKAFYKMPPKIADILTFILGYGVVFGITIVRPALERFDIFDRIENASDYISENNLPFAEAIRYFWSNNITCLTVIGLSIVTTLAIIIVLTAKYGPSLRKIPYDKFCSFALPCLVLYVFAAYLFIGSTEYMNYRDLNMFHNILVAVSFVAVTIWSSVKIVKINK